MNRQQIKEMFLGFALADALGVPVEFQSRDVLAQNPVNSMAGYGTHFQTEGTWSDDSSLALCLADSLTKGYDLKDIALKFIQWKRNSLWTPRGEVFDIGIQTTRSIDRLVNILLRDRDEERLSLIKYDDDEYTNGNGSLMRILPLLYYIKGKEIKEQFAIIWDVSSLTHGHIRAAIACLVYLKFAEYVSEGSSLREAYEEMRKDIKEFFKVAEIAAYEVDKFHRIIENDISIVEEDEINSGGYVIETLEASFWCLLNSESYLEAVFKAINLGDDTDTTATVVGGIAGLYFGMKDVPEIWIQQLARKDDIIQLSEGYVEAFATW